METISIRNGDHCLHSSLILYLLAVSWVPLPFTGMSKVRRGPSCKGLKSGLVQDFSQTQGQVPGWAQAFPCVVVHSQESGVSMDWKNPLIRGIMIPVENARSKRTCCSYSGLSGCQVGYAE